MSTATVMGDNLPRAVPPDRDVRLSDGRVLIRVANFRMISSKGGGKWETRDGLQVIASLDESPHGDLLHVSISYAWKNPKWAELIAVREAFFPKSIDCMMVMPREEDYVNLREHCFHIWQCPGAWRLM